MVKKCDDKTKIYNKKTQKCIKFNSQYFKKLLEEQKSKGIVYFTDQELKEFLVNMPTKPSAKPPTDKPPSTKPPSTKPPSTKPPSTKPPTDKPPSTKPPSTKPPKPSAPSVKKVLSTPQLKNVKHLISKRIQDKLKSYVEKIKERKKNNLTKTVTNYCHNKQLLDIPIIHKYTKSAFTFYDFPHIKGSKQINTLFNNFNMLNNTSIGSLVFPLKHYENNYNPIYLYSEKNNDPLDIEWFNELNEYLKNLPKEDLINLHTYTYHGDKVVNNFLLSENPHTFVNNYIKNNIYSKPSRYFEYSKNIVWPLFIPFIKFVKKISKKYNNDINLVQSHIFKKVSNKDFSIFKNTISLHPDTGVKMDTINLPNGSFETIAQRFIKTNSINYSKYIESLVLISFVKPEHLISIMKLYAESIQSVINNSPKTRKPMTLYRGVSNDYIFKQRKGVYFKNKTFISSTVDYTVSQRFSGNSCCLTYISILPGSQLLWLSGLSRIPAESEFLIGLNTTFMIRSHKKEYIQKYESTPTLPSVCDSLKTSHQMSRTITKVVAL